MKRLGQVYFITDGTAIKIGYSLSAVSRANDLQGANAQPLRIVGMFPGTMSDEKDMHRRFKHLHIRGEWFRIEDDLLDLIARLEQGRRWIEIKSIGLRGFLAGEHLRREALSDFRTWRHKHRDGIGSSLHAELVEIDLGLLALGRANPLGGLERAAMENIAAFEVKREQQIGG